MKRCTNINRQSRNSKYVEKQQGGQDFYACSSAKPLIASVASIYTSQLRFGLNERIKSKDKLSGKNDRTQFGEFEIIVLIRYTYGHIVKKKTAINYTIAHNRGKGRNHTVVSSAVMFICVSREVPSALCSYVAHSSHEQQVRGARPPYHIYLRTRICVTSHLFADDVLFSMHMRSTIEGCMYASSCQRYFPPEIAAACVEDKRERCFRFVMQLTHVCHYIPVNLLLQKAPKSTEPNFTGEPKK